MKLRVIAKVLFGAFFIGAGLNHFISTDFYLSIMPPYLPWHVPLVYVSGVAETALGVLLLVRRWSRIAAWGLIFLLIAVFPANLHMAPECGPVFAVFADPAMAAVTATGNADCMAYFYTRGND